MHSAARATQQAMFSKASEAALVETACKAPRQNSHMGWNICKGTRVIMFTGTMNATRLGIILEAGLLPCIAEKFSGSHRLFHDNDPKHSSHYIEEFFKCNNVNWYPTPPESPDLNPIENVWGSMKQYLRTHYKPKNLQELKDGIQHFWLTLTPEAYFFLNNTAPATFWLVVCF